MQSASGGAGTKVQPAKMPSDADSAPFSKPGDPNRLPQLRPDLPIPRPPPTTANGKTGNKASAPKPSSPSKRPPLPAITTTTTTTPAPPLSSGEEQVSPSRNRPKSGGGLSASQHPNTDAMTSMYRPPPLSAGDAKDEGPKAEGGTSPLRPQKEGSPRGYDEPAAYSVFNRYELFSEEGDSTSPRTRKGDKVAESKVAPLTSQEVSGNFYRYSVAPQGRQTLGQSMGPNSFGSNYGWLPEGPSVSPRRQNTSEPVTPKSRSKRSESVGEERTPSGELQRRNDLSHSKWRYVQEYASRKRERRRESRVTRGRRQNQSVVGSLGGSMMLDESDDPLTDPAEDELLSVRDGEGKAMMTPTLSTLYNDNIDSGNFGRRMGSLDSLNGPVDDDVARDEGSDRRQDSSEVVDDDGTTYGTNGAPTLLQSHRPDSDSRISSTGQSSGPRPLMKADAQPATYKPYQPRIQPGANGPRPPNGYPANQQWNLPRPHPPEQPRTGNYRGRPMPPIASGGYGNGVVRRTPPPQPVAPYMPRPPTAASPTGAAPAQVPVMTSYQNAAPYNGPTPRSNGAGSAATTTTAYNGKVPQPQPNLRGPRLPPNSVPKTSFLSVYGDMLGDAAWVDSPKWDDLKLLDRKLAYKERKK